MAAANLSLQVIPVIEEEKVYPVVDRVIEYIKSRGIKHLVGPMETTMEGELEELLEVVLRAQEICVGQGAGRVITVVKIDYRPGGVTMEEKVGKYLQK